MMMLAASALTAAAVSASAAVFSPSHNSCVKRVGATRFRYDPYCSRVVSNSFVSTPLSMKSPKAARLQTSLSAAIPTPVSISAPSPISATATPVMSAPSVLAPASSVRFAVIRFKQETATFIAPFRVCAGDVVVVEGDRGENVGVVREIMQGKPSGFEVTAKIIRKASEKDLATLAAQREREQSALKLVQSLASSLGLHATIEDVEYQFDLNKLTIFVRRSAKGGFVDFRKLQRGLFREFRCRIWCAYMDEVEAIENGPRSR